MKLEVGIFLVLLSFPLHADQVCFDVPVEVNVSTMDYVAPLTSSKTKAVLLKELWAEKYQAEVNRRMWLEAIFTNDQMLREMDRCQAVVDTCVKAGAVKAQ